MTKKILVIDDEAALRELVCICLEDIGGWQVITAASAAEGLAQATTTPFDAILLDVSMPEMDGFQCYEHLQSAVAPAPPIVLLTAKAQAEDLKRFTGMQIAGIITKPFDPLLLSDQVSKFLNWNSSAD